MRARPKGILSPSKREHHYSKLKLCEAMESCIGKLAMAEYERFSQFTKLGVNLLLCTKVYADLI